jgi:hypothetical protein
MGISAKKKQNQGAAMIVAIVVSVVLVAFALSLLLLSYSLASSASGSEIELQCKELAKSVNSKLRQELLNVDYDSYEEQYAASGNENNLWFFLRYNLWQNDIWPYYNDTETGHGITDSYRYFTLDVENSEEYANLAGQVKVTMYWESDQSTDETDKAFTVLHVRVEVNRDDYAYALDSAYALTVAPYDEATDDEETVTVSDTELNPYGNAIVKNEKWIWTQD